MDTKKSQRFIPQKRRSHIRVKLGVVFYCLVRYFAWFRFRKIFAHLEKNTDDSKIEALKKKFSFISVGHSSILKRNLSPADTALQEGKINNVSIASKKVNGIILEPGKVFSYWKSIGNPTKSKGYKNGMMLVNGKPTAAIGGGLCALSNLIYWMTLHTPLTVIERYRHSYDVFPDPNRTRPFGSGATCVYNYRDLMIRNDTNQAYALLIWIENDILKGEWRTENETSDFYQVYQKDHWITAETGGAYVRHNTIWRKHYYIEENGEKRLIEDKLIAENNALMMYEPLLEEKNGKIE